VILSVEQAQAILEVFGPCSSTYECTSAAEIVEAAKEYPSLSAFCKDLIEGESVFWEQRGNQWSGEDEEKFKAEVRADKALLAGIRHRVKDFLRTMKTWQGGQS
jgi:hypothetical protein